ncbi:MAG: HAD family hydrolase [Lachnospiraceae bacterium]|nr:HAD family hydrolase [Lachnospiraceae bacterium]
MVTNAFIFDMDDTLYLRKDPYIRAYRDMFSSFLLDEEELYRVSRKWSEITFRRQKQGEVSLEQMHVDRVVSTFREMGREVSVKEALAFQDRYAYHQDHITLREGTEKVLSYLNEKGAFLGLLSNGPSDHQRAKYRALGLAAYIPEDQVLISGDLGIHKPDVGIFHAYEDIIEKKGFETDKSRICIIGDSLETDIAGGRGAGWMTILLRNPGLEEKAEAQPDLEAADMGELLTLLQALT